MQLAAVAAALFAALAAASPLNAPLDSPLDAREAVTARIVATPTFVVYNFTAVCIMHGKECLYDFDLWGPGIFESTAPGAAPGEHCQKLVASDSTPDPVLPAVAQGPCWYTSATWSISHQADGGLNITTSVQVDPLAFATGSHIIPAQELRVYQDITGRAQRYVGPSEFELF